MSSRRFPRRRKARFTAESRSSGPGGIGPTPPQSPRAAAVRALRGLHVSGLPDLRHDPCRRLAVQLGVDLHDRRGPVVCRSGRACPPRWRPRSTRPECRLALRAAGVNRCVAARTPPASRMSQGLRVRKPAGLCSRSPCAGDGDSHWPRMRSRKSLVFAVWIAQSGTDPV